MTDSTGKIRLGHRARQWVPRALCALAFSTIAWSVTLLLSIVRTGQRDRATSHDAAIVLGAAVSGAKPSPVYRERLLESPHLTAKAKRELRAQRAKLNPFELHRKLEEGLRRVLHRTLRSSRPPGSLRSASNAATTPLTSVS